MKQVAERNGILFIHFEGDQWTSLLETRHGPREFTLARAHDIVDDLAVPTLCLIEGQSREDGQSLFIGCVSSKAAVTTFETRLKIRRTMQIRPPSLRQLTRSLVPELRRRVRALVNDRLVTVLHRGADEVINALFSIVSNRDAMQLVANSLSSPRSFEDVVAEQEDAVRTALKAFGITYDDEAASLQLVSGQDTALSRVAVMEDSVIEHDARYIPGFRLLRSDLTGRAVFEHGDEQLEVFTANRRQLEHLLVLI